MRTLTFDNILSKSKYIKMKSVILILCIMIAHGLSDSNVDMFGCMSLTARFYARVDSVFSNFNYSSSVQVYDQFLSIGNDLMTSSVSVFIYVPGLSTPLTSTGIVGFANLLTDFIAPVDCGEQHIFSFPVLSSENGPCCNNITLWVDEVSVTNAGVPNAPFGAPCGPQNGTAVLIPGRFAITCYRDNLLDSWKIDSITEKFRANVATGLSWTPPGWQPMDLPNNTYP